MRFQHHGAAGLADIARFLHADVPTAFAHQSIAVLILLNASRTGIYLPASGRAELADLRIAVGSLRHQEQVGCGGYVARIQAGGLIKTGVAHAQTLRFGIHGLNERAHAAGVSARQSVDGAVFAAHKAQVQQLGACQLCADAQTATGAFQAVDFRFGDGDGLTHVQACIQNHHGRHQFGDGGDGAYAVHIFLEKNLTGVGIHDGGSLRVEQRCGISRLLLCGRCGVIVGGRDGSELAGEVLLQEIA